MILHRNKCYRFRGGNLEVVSLLSAYPARTSHDILHSSRELNVDAKIHHGCDPVTKSDTKDCRHVEYLLNNNHGRKQTYN